VGSNDGISEYCRAEDDSWKICKWENALWVPESKEWLDCWRVTVQLPEGVASPWFTDAKSVTVGITFNTYDEAWAHVNRQDLMVWALTVHALDLSQGITHWRRRVEDVDPTSKRFRALEFLDDIRCAILDSGWPLGDDSDPELTPVRLVKEILARVAHLEECNKNQYDMLRQSRLLQPVLSYKVPVREGEVTHASFDLQGMNDFESYTLPPLFEKKETP